MAHARRGLRRPARAVIAGAIVGAMLGSWPLPARAGESDLDPTFGTGGQVTTAFPGRAGAEAVARVGHQILVAGDADVQGAEQIAVARYRQNGRLDQTFGTDGKVIVRFPGHAFASELVTLPDGRFVVGGTLFRPGTERDLIAIARFLPDGRLDSTFGGDGRVVADLGVGDWRVSAMVRQVNGKLVVGGSHRGYDGPLSFMLARFARDGSLDRAYGNEGHVITPFPGDQTDAYIAGMAIDVDGRVIAAGSMTTINVICRTNWALARYLPDGSLDRTFGGDGRVVTPFSHIDASASAVAFGDDNRLTVAGSSTRLQCGHDTSEETGQAAVARYLPNGRLDPTFGGDGKIETTFFATQDSDPKYSDLTLEEGGQIAAMGSALRPRSGRSVVFVALYQRNGRLNTAFSTDGKAFAAGPFDESFGNALYEDIEGRPVVVGTAFQSSDGGLFFLVERFTASS